MSTIRVVGRPQGLTKHLWVKDGRTSESLAVMARIGFTVLPEDGGKTKIKPPEREQTSIRCTMMKGLYKN